LAVRGVTAILYRGVVTMSKLLVLALAVLALTACGTTERSENSLSDSQASSDTPRPRMVVRGPVVADEGDDVAAVERKAAPAKPRTANAAATAGLGAKASAAVSATAAAAAEALAATPETPAATPAPVVETALPTLAADKTAPVKPNTMSTDFTAIIQSVIGGMPVWLMALIGVVLLAAVVLGFTGGRKSAGEA
jgi:hypothetical protein